MKMLKIGIASYGEVKARTLAIARGELKPKPTDPKVSLPLDGEPGPGSVGQEPAVAGDHSGQPAAVPVRSSRTDRQGEVELVSNPEDHGALRNCYARTQGSRSGCSPGAVRRRDGGYAARTIGGEMTGGTPLTHIFALS